MGVRLQDLDATAHTDKSYLHGFTRFYDQLLHDLDPARVLEIGVLQGDSLRMWADYWPGADVHGIDIHDVDVPGATVHVGNAYDDEMVRSLPGPFDFILDDGPHDPICQAWFCQRYPALLAPGGVLAIEDVWSPDHFKILTENLPEEFRPYSYGVDLRSTAPDQGWSNHLIFVVDTRRGHP